MRRGIKHYWKYDGYLTLHDGDGLAVVVFTSGAIVAPEQTLDVTVALTASMPAGVSSCGGLH